MAANDLISIDIKYSRSVAFRSQGNLGAADCGECGEEHQASFHVMKLRRLPFQMLRLLRLRMKRPLVQPLGLSDGRARSITTEAARHRRLILAAI